MRKRTSDYSSDTDQRVEGEEEDVNLLRCSTRARFTGFKEAKNSYEHGTDEVRRLLLHECNLIYECSVCRNMFRSLNNFISHKRSYCVGTNSLAGGNNNGFPDQQAVDIIKGLKSNLFTKNKATGTQAMNGGSNVNCLGYNKVQENSKKFRCGETVGIKAEVDQLISKMETVLTSSCSASTKNTYNFTSSQKMGSVLKIEPVTGKLMCSICNLEFHSEKALRVHNQKKHLTPTYAFQCPACSLTFMQPAAVMRHLAQEHKKSVRRIRMMRETIVKRRLQPGEVCQAKSSGNRELKRLQDCENGTSPNGIDTRDQKKVMSKCIYCDKSFERRAALSTHLMSCRLKLEALEKQQMPAEKRLKLSQQLSASVYETSTPPTTAVVNVSVKEELSDSNSLNEMFANLDKQSFGSGLQTVSLDKVEISEGENGSIVEDTAIDSQDVQMGIESTKSPQCDDKYKLKPSDVKDEDINIKIEDGVGNALKQSCRCKICNKQFNALSNLRRHISMFHYRARKFGCKLCDYRAFRRYDIVNHLGFVHKMTDDRETMSEAYVSVHEVHYSKDDMDGDIVLITDEQEMLTFTEDKRMRTYEKRVRRKKMITPAASTDTASEEGDGKPTRLKLKRSHSQQASSFFMEDCGVNSNGATKSQQKRPIRNRIKPVNKDFVYDLSNLLKEELPPVLDCDDELAVRQLKRRNTMFPVTDAYYSNQGSLLVEPLIFSTSRSIIKGAVQRLTLLLVQQGRAASATLPELPAERPQMRPRLTSTCRVDMQAVPVIETSDLEAARLKSTLLEDSFLEKISKRSGSGSGFKIKPCLELQHSALDTLLQKVDSSYHNNGSVIKALTSPVALNKEIKLKIIAPTTQIDAICQLSACTEAMHASAAAALLFDSNSSPEATIPIATSPPSTPRKRVTLVQRLAENKAKQRDSFLRAALEN